MSTWLVSGTLGLLPILQVIPGDRYRVHPIGLTLSIKMDELMLYEIIMLGSLVIVWTFTVASYVLYTKKATMRRRLLGVTEGHYSSVCSRTGSVIVITSEAADQEASTEVNGKAFKDHYDCNHHHQQQLKRTSFIKLIMSKHHSRTDVDRQLWSSMAVVITAFTICYLPLIITQCFSHSKNISLLKQPDTFDPYSNFIFNSIMFISSRVVMCNSFVNGIIYSIMDRHFFLALKGILRRF